jgi:L-asparaginase
MKKLLIITTGGTIAGIDHGSGIVPALSGDKLIPDIGGVGISILDLYSIDSTDVTPMHWQKLYSAVTENVRDFDGIVILHGTDTMAYTGAVLAFTLDTDKPVILTGSMLPSDAEGSDAQTNIEFAMHTAASGNYKGVYLAFAGRVIGGADIVKVSSTDKDAFRSYAGFVPDKRYAFPEHGGRLPAVVRLTPFSDGPDISAPAENKAGIVIETYGAGGLPDNGITAVISGLARTMPVIVTSPCMGGTDLGKYEVGRRALAASAIDAGKRSTECAAVELWLQINSQPFENDNK